MLLYLEKLIDNYPRLRMIFYYIDCLFGKTMFLCYLLCAIAILSPTMVAYFNMPENIRVEVSAIIGGFVSLIIVPLASIYIKHRNKKLDELYEINKPLYEKLVFVLLQLLSDEYILHNKDFKQVVKTLSNDEVEIVLKPLETFICDNYGKMCNAFSAGLIMRIFEVYQECSHSVTKYINIRRRIRLCIRLIRKESGAKGTFYISQKAIELNCNKNSNLSNHKTKP